MKQAVKKRLLKNERAEVMVEASLVLTTVVIIIVTLAYLGLIMYHQTLITSTANQTASNIAQVYSNSGKDPVTGYIDVSNLDNDGIVNKMKSQAYSDSVSKKAEWYSKYRLAKGNFLKTDEPEVDVEIVNKKGALLRAQVVVTVKENYELPFVQLLGIENPVIEYKATGRADCYEILDYVNVVEATDKIDVTENFTVTFHNKDNSVYDQAEVMHDMSIADTMKLSSAEQTKFPEDPVLAGEKFYRWKTETGDTFTKNTVVTGDMDVYAEYDCKVRFMNYDGTAALYEYFAHRNQPFSSSGNSVPNGPAEEGDNKFYCWWYNNAEFKASTQIPDADSINVTIRKCFWVKFDANGGGVNPSRIFVAPGSAIGNMPTPWRNAYGFGGWFNQRSGGNQYNNNSVINSNVQLYAHWNCLHPSSHMVYTSNTCQYIQYNEYCNVCGAFLGSFSAHGEHEWVRCNGKNGQPHKGKVDLSKPNGSHFKTDYQYTNLYYHKFCKKCRKSQGKLCYGHIRNNGGQGYCKWQYSLPSVKCPY